MTVEPFSLRDAPALIERLLPVQKLSAESFKEQMANVGKTLTALGSYWKGRKPLILAKACVLGCLLPATDDPVRDLAIFEQLMAMDDASFVVRAKKRLKPKDLLATLSIRKISDYFTVSPTGAIPETAPIDWSVPEYAKVKVSWRNDISERERRQLEAQVLTCLSYRDRVDMCRRPEEIAEVHDHIWDDVNNYLGTTASSFPELIEQLGVMRYGHRPRLGDTFCGSGQIPFEAARLGCDVFASDLNPIASMLTWGALNIIGGPPESRTLLVQDQETLITKVQAELERLGVETDNNGWQAKAFIYCVEVRCPQTGWKVPLLPSLIISHGKRCVADLAPDPENKRFEITLRCNASDDEMERAKNGTVGRESRFGDAYVKYSLNGKEYKTSISTIRGDYTNPDGMVNNHIRQWNRSDFKPRPDDIYQDRLYAIHWMRQKEGGRSYDYEFRSVTEEDLERERVVEDFIAEHLEEWQRNGWIPDMRIEPGGPPRYENLRLIRGRGWTHWHHLFNPRQLLVNGLINRWSDDARLKFGVTQATNWNSKWV